METRRLLHNSPLFRKLYSLKAAWPKKLITAISFPILVRDLRDPPRGEAVLPLESVERYEAFRMTLAAHRAFRRSGELKIEPVLNCSEH